MNAHRPDCPQCHGSGDCGNGRECLCDKLSCWHGRLARSCEACEAAARIAELERWQREAAPFVESWADDFEDGPKARRLLSEAGQ